MAEIYFCRPFWCGVMNTQRRKSHRHRGRRTTTTQDSSPSAVNGSLTVLAMEVHPIIHKVRDQSHAEHPYQQYVRISKKECCRVKLMLAEEL